MFYAIAMVYINVTSFVLISQSEKDHIMIATRYLKKIVIFFPKNYKFCAVKKGYIHLQWYSTKNENVAVEDFWKYEKLKYKQKKLQILI